MKNVNFNSAFTFIQCGLIFLIASGCNKDEPVRTVTDIDNNVYKTVKIGNQEWMAENLRVERFRNGDSIGSTSTPTEDLELVVEPNFQWSYEGDENNALTYGRLYTYYSIVDTRGLCPEGWHVPSDQEWTILIEYSGGENNAQQILRENNFNPQYGGLRSTWEFYDLDLYGHYWSNTPVENTVPGAIDQVYIRTMAKGATIVYRSYRYKKSGASLRCIKDE